VISTTYLARLGEVAARFRAAIEIVGADLGTPFGNFPRGCCGQATLLLGTHLVERGFGEFAYMLGRRRIFDKAADESHAWLQRGDLIVDITADQFAGINDAVVVTTDSDWYQQFEPKPEHVADYRIFDAHTVAVFSGKYSKITATLNRNT
jgi:hypothetical protein